ncbi:hypothetical protein GALL_532190 [mine drainage metagenome]|uniref:Uncharacterized protein n=1 Tax=mine drainage metagenome TaxID=410659 RepID=A0A1J5P108_9ZZZZ
MYDKQTWSKKSRASLNLYNRITKNENAYEAIYSKYFKKSYNGYPTKKYLKMLKAIKQTEKITVDDIERMYLK